MVHRSIISNLSKLSANEVIFALFLFFLPFTQALTINVGFPLKISELLLFLLLFIYLITSNILNFKLSRLTITLFFFTVVIFVSFIVNIFYKYPYNLILGDSRFSPFVDSLLKFFYVLIAIFAMLVSINELSKNSKLVKFFLWGAIVSSLYSWYLFASGVLKLPVLLLPGMNDPAVINTPFGDIIRCGTFKEGNFMGLYLVIAAIVAFYQNKVTVSVFLFLTIITTFSTAAMACSFIFFMIFLIKKYKKHKFKLIGALSLTALVLFLLIQFNSSFKSYFFDKIFASEDTVENTNDVFSKVDRLNTTYVGLSMFYDNPVFGVGLSNYSLHYYHYNLLPELDVVGFKRIPNNIYIEIMSETGIFGIFTFLYFLIQIYNIGKRKSRIILASGLIACYFYFFAFPSFTLLFIWVFFGIVCSLNNHQSNSNDLIDDNLKLI
jgi:O-antigen ligase